MTRSCIIASALILATGTFFTANVQYASAMPMQGMTHAAKDGIVNANCAPGTPNCVPMGAGTPQKCGGPGNPCVIDGAPDCQNASSCGTDDTGDHNLNGASNMPGVISDIKQPSGGGKPSPGNPSPSAAHDK